MYDTLLSQINNYIKANGENEITGPVLNNILGLMVQALGTGMSFYGVADLSTRPVSNQYPKFYIAFTPGNYVNFNISNQPSFTSGFAVITDSAGNNTWSMSVKSFKDSTNTFLIDATVKDNVYGTNITFYIGDAERTNQSSNFTVYTHNDSTNTDTLVATYSSSRLETGYNEHELTTSNNITLRLAVNWDAIPTNEHVEFNIEDTSFPPTAYIETSSDLDCKNLLTRLGALEEMLGYRFDAQDNFVRQGVYSTGDFYIGPIMRPDYFDDRPSDLNDFAGTPHNGSRERFGYMANPQSVTTIYTVELVSANFPESGIYSIFLPNVSGVDHILKVVRLEDDGVTIIDAEDYQFKANSVTELKILKLPSGIMRSGLKYTLLEYL